MSYLGETVVKQKDTPYKDYGPVEWAMLFIEKYGGCDGGDHKAWVLDQVARCLKGCPVTIKKAQWTEHPPEYRFSVGTNKTYENWIKEMVGEDENGDPEYGYDEGSPP